MGEGWVCVGNKMVDVSRKESEKKKVASALSISGAEILLGCEQVHELPHSQNKITVMLKCILAVIIVVQLQLYFSLSWIHI